MWRNEFESEPYGTQGMIFYEPLPTIATEDCQPYCCLIRTTIFYKKPWPGKLEKIDKVQSQWDLLGHRFTDEIDGWACVAPFVWHSDELYELHSGKVIWRNDQWHKKWTARRVSTDDRRWPLLENVCGS